MREVGVDGGFAAPDLGYSFRHFGIHSDCEKRLLDIELDLSSSVCTFEAVKWAISELRLMELREQYSGAGEGDAKQDEAREASLSRSSGREKIDRGTLGGRFVERLPDRSRPDTPDLGNIDSTTSWTGIKLERESFDHDPIKGDDKNVSPRGPEHLVEEREGLVGRQWTNMFKATSSAKRKSDNEASGIESDKRPKVTEVLSLTNPKAAVMEADEGVAGKRMADRINSRLAVPECVFLTNLISHCLLVSMDQVPTRAIREALAALCANGTGRADSTGDSTGLLDSVEGTLPITSEGQTDNGEWMWLHAWLVRTVFADTGDDDNFASLDWLVAFMTATRTTIIKPVLDDLASDLQRREAEGAPTLVSYLRRTGVLEFAAPRDPEGTFGSIRNLFPPAVFPRPRNKGDDRGCNELWQGWLGLMVLCPKLFGAFSRLWIPTLSAETVKLWRMGSAPASLPAIWTILMDTQIEEPETKREWLRAAILRRLPLLAPVASYVAVLLGGLDDNLADDGYFGIGNYLLDSVYKELCRHMLPKIVGNGPDSSREVHAGADKLEGDSDIILFMENLKQHSHVLWRKALEHYSTSNCACCAVELSEEVSLEASGRTESEKDGSMCIDRKGEGGSEVKLKHACGIELQRGCMYRDPLIHLCHLTLLCCTEHVVADLLAEASFIRPSSIAMFDTRSLRRLLMVMRVMRIVSAQGRGTNILELWAEKVANQMGVASDEQALLKILAIRQLLDPSFWESHHILLGSSSQFRSAVSVSAVDDVPGHQGSSWKLVCNVLHTVMDAQWLNILPLLHREGAWDLRLAVLGVLKRLSPDTVIRPQVVAERLKGVLGLFFSWLEMPDVCIYTSSIEQNETAVPTSEPRWRWQSARAMEHLKSIIIRLGSSSFPSFTLMVNSLLDFSFEHNIQMSTIPSPSSLTNTISRIEISGTPMQKIGAASRSSLCMAPLSTGRLDRYGKLVLASQPAQIKSSIASLQKVELQLMEENRRIQSGAVTPFQMHEKERAERLTRNLSTNKGVPMPEKIRKDLIKRTKVFEAELGSLLRRSLEGAISHRAEFLDGWPYHPASVLATLLTDRLETPHEVSLTMEQYEEVLPKHISSLRHIFLIDCFSQNPLLMQMVELVVKYGENREVLRCVEFLRVLLADSISRWHSAFRTRWPHSLPPAKVDEDEAWNRMQVNRLIQVVASANWLPQSLAASGEIVSVIDGADIADLLLLVWRCMHHAMAFGSKGWASSTNSHVSGGSDEGQAISTGSGVDDGKEGTYTEWESHFFAILRHNVSQIGAHFAQVYPIRKAF